MNRILAILVVLLTAAVGGLTIAVVGLNDRVASVSSGRSASVVTRPHPDDDQTEEIAALKSKLASMEAQLVDVRREVTAERTRAPAPVDAGGSHANGNASIEPPPPSTFSPGAPPRGPDGAPIFSDEQIQHAIALKKEVERRERVDQMSRNVMRRIDGLAAKGTIAPVQDFKRTQVEQVVRKYLAQADELVRQRMRDPEASAETTTAEERREFLRIERERMVEESRVELTVILGERDAGEVAEAALVSSYLPRTAGERVPRRESR